MPLHMSTLDDIYLKRVPFSVRPFLKSGAIYLLSLASVCLVGCMHVVNFHIHDILSNFGFLTPTSAQFCWIWIQDEYYLGLIVQPVVVFTEVYVCLRPQPGWLRRILVQRMFHQSGHSFTHCTKVQRANTKDATQKVNLDFNTGKTKDAVL